MGGRSARLLPLVGGRLVGGGEKGGEAVARTLRATNGSRYHLATDAGGIPLLVRVAPGNENEQRHLLPLVDELLSQGVRPGELWADRGYASRVLAEALRERRIEPRISQPRRAGQPIPEGTPVREVWRGKKRRLKTPDAQARQRWPIERTNAWLHGFPRIHTRQDRKSTNYLAFLQIAMILIHHRSF